MTATLVAKGLAGGYAHRTLFDSLDLTVAPGDVVGVVGVNGSGEQAQESGLAGTVDADHPHNVAGSDREVEGIEEGAVGVPAGQALRDERCGHAPILSLPLTRSIRPGHSGASLPSMGATA
jgi:ABC-type uncharacterized transport system ATPase subunit